MGLHRCRRGVGQMLPAQRCIMLGIQSMCASKRMDRNRDGVDTDEIGFDINIICLDVLN